MFEKIFCLFSAFSHSSMISDKKQVVFFFEEWKPFSDGFQSDSRDTWQIIAGVSYNCSGESKVVWMNSKLLYNGIFVQILSF